MIATLLLNYDEDVRKVEEEEKAKFLRNLLEQMGVPISEIWTSDHPLTVEQKIRLRDILSTFGIQIIENLDGYLQVYVEGEKVAEWDKTQYRLKRDLRHLDPRKQLYLEMTIHFWTLFEETEQPHG